MNHSFLTFVLIKCDKYAMRKDFLYSAKDDVPLLRKTLLFIIHRYSRTSKIWALILDLPPVGRASTFSHTRHLTFVDVFPKTFCSFLHFGQRSFTKREVDSRISPNSIKNNKKRPFKNIIIQK